MASTNRKSYTPRAVLNAPPAQRRHLLRRFWLPAVLLLALAAGGLTGIIAAYQLNYSQAASEVAALATYRPSVVTRVYADDGKTEIGEFALEKRIPLKYEEIPPMMKNAILAIEDARFYDHIGIDPIRILGAAWKNVTTQKVEGASTLTQQLAKNLFLSKEQTVKRKVNEWALALQIERYYTKSQIMELYANHIFLGANAYGVEAGAETYFGKQAKDLTLEEAALLAGIPKAPGEYSPTIHPDKAKERRDLVLDQMAKTGFATEADVAADFDIQPASGSHREGSLRRGAADRDGSGSGGIGSCRRQGSGGHEGMPTSAEPSDRRRRDIGDWPGIAHLVEGAHGEIVSGALDQMVDQTLNLYEHALNGGMISKDLFSSPHLNALSK